MAIKVEITKVFKTKSGSTIREDTLVKELKKALQEKDEPGIRILTSMLQDMGVYHNYPEFEL